MFFEKLELQLDYEAAGLKKPPKEPEFTGMIPGVRAGLLRPAVLVLPGGGYTHTAYHEGIPIALEFAAGGAAAFVLHYSVRPDAVFPTPLAEAFAAVRVIRSRAAEWQIDPEKIAVCGFSAGGHLASAMGTGWNSQTARDLGFAGESHKPNGMILGYAAVRIGDLMSPAEKEELCSGPDSALQAFLCTDQMVSSQTPPAFLWHTAADETVPSAQSLAFAAALAANGIPYELHVYPRGVHGLGLARPDGPRMEKRCESWIRLAREWLGEL